MRDGPSATSARMAQYATASPRAPPATPSTTLSTRNCWMRRAASGADGRAHGHFARAAVRAGQQQIGHVDAGDEQHERDGAQQDQQRRTDAAHDAIVQPHRRHDAVLVRYWDTDRDRRRATIAIALLACSSVTPGFRRAIAPTHWAPRCLSLRLSLEKISGRQYSAPAGIVRSGGATPITVNGLPSSRIVEPTMSERRAELSPPESVADDRPPAARPRCRRHPRTRGRAAASRRGL